MRMLFGTDGIRGVAGDPPLDHSTIFAVGAALGRHLLRDRQRARVVLGQDTRESSPWIAASLIQGLAWAGVEAESAGVITTPAIAYLARRNGFNAGIVISASHNPWTDNGIKVFAHDGYKLSDEVEEGIEADIFDMLHGRSPDLGNPPRIPAANTIAVNSVITHPDLLDAYANWLIASVQGTSLRGLRALVDCANGAATPVARRVFASCGVKTALIHDTPNGRNINERCGALYPKVVAEAVRPSPGAWDLGITFDGDADRALFCDARGNVVNGDGVLLLAGRDMKSRGLLRTDTLVATTMSNMGLEIALSGSGIHMLRAPVGDKYVLEEMRRVGASLGGEQSGHILFRDGEATTGDGLLTALRIMEIMARTRRSLADLVADLRVFPQNIKNVRVRDKRPLDQIPEIAVLIRQAEEELDGSGRVVVRYSGTEALARVMVEAESEEQMARITDSIAGAIQKNLGID